MKKTALLTGLCISALALSACSNQKRVVGSKGDQYTVNKDVQKVDNDSKSFYRSNSFYSSCTSNSKD